MLSFIRTFMSEIHSVENNTCLTYSKIYIHILTAIIVEM